MAKIKYVKLFLEDGDIDEYGFRGNIVVKAKLEFNKTEISSGLFFRLHFFLRDAKKEYQRISDAPFKGNLIGLGGQVGNGSDFFWHQSLFLRADRPSHTIQEPIYMDLCETTFSKGLKIFAMLVPEDDCASKWSNEYYFNIILK